MKFKVKCTGYKSDERFFTIGKTYIWQDDTITNDNGHTYRAIVGGNDINKWELSRFYIFERVNAEMPKILITTDGTTTLARLYEGKKVVKSAEAKYNPADLATFPFDFTEGAGWAFEKLTGLTVQHKNISKPTKPQHKPTPKLVKQTVQVGDFVRRNANGEVCKVIALSSTWPGAVYVNTKTASCYDGGCADRPICQPFDYLHPNQYSIVLDGYTGE